MSEIRIAAIMAALAAAVVIAAPPVGGEGRNGETVSRIRIRSYPQTDSEKAAYTVRIDSPWENGGYLHVNFPEHLEYGPVGYTITRYSDPGHRHGTWSGRANSLITKSLVFPAAQWKA